MKFIGILITILLLAASIAVFNGNSHESYDSIVIFRNDDVTNVDSELENLDKLFNEQNIPVTHSIIPSKVVPKRPKKRGASGKVHPVGLLLFYKLFLLSELL